MTTIDVDPAFGMDVKYVHKLNTLNVKMNELKKKKKKSHRI